MPHEVSGWKGIFKDYVHHPLYKNISFDQVFRPQAAPNQCEAQTPREDGKVGRETLALFHSPSPSLIPPLSLCQSHRALDLKLRRLPLRQKFSHQITKIRKCTDKDFIFTNCFK